MSVSVYLVIVTKDVMELDDFPKPVKEFIIDDFEEITLGRTTLYYKCEYELYHLFEGIKLNLKDIEMIMTYLRDKSGYGHTYKIRKKEDSYWNYISDIQNMFEELPDQYIIEYLQLKKYMFHEIVADN